MPRRANSVQVMLDIIENPIHGFIKHLPKVISRKHPEASTAMEVARILAGAERASASRLREMPIDGDPAEAIRELKRRKYGTPIIVGLQNSGKTVFATWLARTIDNKVNACLGMPAHQVPHDFKKLNSIAEMFKLPKGSTIILDDVGQLASIYSYGRKSGQQVIDLVTLCRHYGFVMIIICQNTSAINKHWLDTIDMCFIKKPGISAGFERPALRDPYRRAQQMFNQQSQHWVWEHIYCWSQYGEGLLRYNATEVR